MKSFLLTSVFIVPIVLAACGQDDVPPPSHGAYVKPPVIDMPQAPEKKERPRYVYKGDRYRDPFIPITGEGSSVSATGEEAPVPNIGALVLKGIFNDAKIKMAIISGGGITYVLKGSRLYDNRQRLVRGITGVIKNDSVLMIAPDKTSKELRLRERP